jgi:hypothetical protein
MKRSYQVLRGLAPLYRVSAAHVPRAWRNAVDTVYLSSDSTKHPVFRTEPLPAAKRMPGKKRMSGLDRFDKIPPYWKIINFRPYPRAGFSRDQCATTGRGFTHFSAIKARPTNTARRCPSRLYTFHNSRRERVVFYEGGLGRSG